MNLRLNSLNKFLFILSLSLPSYLMATTGTIQANERSTRQNNHLIQQHQQEITSLTSEINLHKAKVANSEKAEDDLRRQLDHLQGQIALAKQNHNRLQQLIAVHQGQIKIKGVKLDGLQRANYLLQEKTEKRLRSYYQMGEIGFFNVVFSANSLPELLTFNQYYQFLLQHDHKVLAEYQTNINDLRQSRDEMETELSKINSAFNAAAEQEFFLKQADREKQNLLTRIQTEKSLSQLAINEMTAAKKKLRAALENLQLRNPVPLLSSSVVGQGSQEKFAHQKGFLPFPVHGQISNTFNQQHNILSPEPASQGIAISSTPGSPIKAVHAGQVIYADFLQNYGNLIIIDHGDNYLTLTGGLGQSLVRTGIQINAGEIIARSSLHQGKLKKEIIFQIRHHRRPQNPMNWLDQTIINK